MDEDRDNGSMAGGEEILSGIWVPISVFASDGPQPRATSNGTACACFKPDFSSMLLGALTDGVSRERKVTESKLSQHTGLARLNVAPAMEQWIMGTLMMYPFSLGADAVAS